MTVKAEMFCFLIDVSDPRTEPGNGRRLTVRARKKKEKWMGGPTVVIIIWTLIMKPVFIVQISNESSKQNRTKKTE